MKRIVTIAISAAFALLLLPGTNAQAQTASTGPRVAQAPTVSKPGVTDASAQRRRRCSVCRSIGGMSGCRDVYPRYNPGPNAVRDCTATYVQEYRPSGPVITPRMNCYWRPG